jgi:hypothetical protein
MQCKHERVKIEQPYCTFHQQFLTGQTCTGCINYEAVFRYKLDYSPEAEMFSLDDTKEQVIIILSREQLEELMKFYHQQIG